MILLDTNALLWVAFDDTKLSIRARTAINEARQNGDGLAVSDISLLELTNLHRKRKIQLKTSLESFLREIEAYFLILPISASACVQSLALPIGFPKDPADRIIAATAIVKGIPLITSDREIRKCRSLATIW